MNEINFVDIMEPRKTQCGIVKFMSRAWNPKRTLEMTKYYSPQELKNIVANSVYLDSVIDAESIKSGVQKEKLKKEILDYLEEIGLDKKMHVIRWMGIVLLKITFMMKIGIMVNETAVLKLKSTMGKNPLLFLPTHRSYADFCLMSYLCYHYDIELPGVAAGMDFYSMAVLGRRMRETGAFYIRRTLVGAPLYAATLRQYVRTLVANYCAPIEFFLEGTRSRSNKSLPPKYGMLSMMLMPLFSREVTDITIVPVNISYDRLMEHGLFAYEHLGVPKPKETTGGLVKSLRVLNDHFGNTYINLGSPLSVKEYLQNDTMNSNESLKPIDMQQLTTEQFTKVQEIADHVITLQQQNTVATISNLMALVLMQSLMRNEALTKYEVCLEVEWMINVLRQLGASVYETDIKGSVERILSVHSKMMRLDNDGKLRLVSSGYMELSDQVKSKMKGHILKEETMVTAIPVIELQLYVNPILHYLVPPAIICVIVQRGNVSRDKLFNHYAQLRKLLKHDFFYTDKNEETIFNTSLKHCLQNGVIIQDDASFVSGNEYKLRYLLQTSIWPALSSLLKCADVMIEQRRCEHKKILKLVQERVESSQCHPYCLSLEATANCLQGLALAGALSKNRNQHEVIYQIVPEILEECRSLVTSVLPTFTVHFDRKNAVVLDKTQVISRL